MKPITFIDVEVDPGKGKILDIGSVKSDGTSFHSDSAAAFIKYLRGSQYICGHNIFHHDLKYLKNIISNGGSGGPGSGAPYFIDTLHLSPLLFPAKPYHALLKDDKLQTEDTNNPLNDAKKARDLFFDEVAAFQQTDNLLKRIFYLLLKDKKEFQSFFQYLSYEENEEIDPDSEPEPAPAPDDIVQAIQKKFLSLICRQANLTKIITDHPIELAYCLALINTKSSYSITPPWVLINYPAVERVMFLLRNNPCLQGCAYCNDSLDIHKGLKRFFGFDSYRTYAGQPLQEKAVSAAIANKSILAVFPTGGGKSLTFQVPALMSGINSRGLTVVISPLQSLMKDQVDNLEKAGITDAVTINGLLDPIERANSLERVGNGSASILYISPESLRSKTIERLLLGRNIVRFVIDEAHCFSSWGQDFRVDYLYIGDFIRSIQKKKNLEHGHDGIPVSCFTATAKPKVIADIRDYFREKLSLEMEVFNANATRSNLRYIVFKRENEEEKYNTVRDLIDEKNCPTIIYVSRTRKAYALAERLTTDGYLAKPYHGRMEKQEKTENQDAFIRGGVNIMVATSAFGMGVDKKDVGMVIHFDISDSLENYIQEAGRAGRDETISADCFVLFNEEDLDKHFILLNQSKLSIKEIQQVWRAVKDLTRLRSKVSQSALEVARRAGWDDSIYDIETRVKTAIAALEEAGYLKRGHNMPLIYANSILAKNAREAIDKINASGKFGEQQKVQAVRIIRKLFSSKSRKHLSEEEAESRVDYISDHLGIVKDEVIQIVNLLREEKILADAKDLTAFIKTQDNINRSLNILKTFRQLEKFLFTVLDNEEKTFHIKELNEQAAEAGCNDVTPHKIKTILNFWAAKNWIKRRSFAKNHIAVICLPGTNILEEKFAKRNELAQFIAEHLFHKSQQNKTADETAAGEILIEFSVLEIKKEFESRMTLFNTEVSTEDIEDALFYLSKIEAIKIEGGFMVVYNALTIERLEQDNKKRYKAEDYQKLKEFYENKMQQIHIAGEYARKMIEDYSAALQFVDDYFQLNYPSFLNKYFSGRKKEITRSITPSKFRQLFGELSPTQLKIINDNESPYIVVAAGPGSGKTRILVHKLASLLLMEDVRHEQLLMVTFSRAAATEFKKRLLNLIGNAANYIEIKTFHSYCFDLLGRVGTIDKSGDIIREAVSKINSGEVETSKITKTVLVIDEAQDMDANEFALINALMEKNEEMRVIAVGDDDQNIYEFRGSSSEYMEKLLHEKEAVMYELIENYRSKKNLVEFSNQFLNKIPRRLKQTPIMAVRGDNGKIKLVRYRHPNLLTPLVSDILSEGFSGSTCVLTKTNDEAVQITGLLIKHGLPAKLIQTNEGFSLYNLLEMRYFLNRLNLTEGTYTIGDDNWEKAKRNLIDKYANSLNLELCLNIIKNFEAVNPKNKYKSDLDIFIRESRMEDFFGENIETIIVSTIHKAKGQEFDNVYLMLDQFNAGTAEALRQLYVAMTRAKHNLTVHYNGRYLDFIKTENLNIISDSQQYPPPPHLAGQLTYRDVYLNYFKSTQVTISRLNSGDILMVEGDCCYDSKGEPVLKISKKYTEELEDMKQKGYEPKTAKIRFIIYWQKENSEYEIRIVLPELYFENDANPVP